MIINFTGCSKNSMQLCSNAPTKHFAGHIGAVKWHPYNVKAKVSALTKSASLWARKSFAKYGAASDPIGISIT